MTIKVNITTNINKKNLKIAVMLVFLLNTVSSLFSVGCMKAGLLIRRMNVQTGCGHELHESKRKAPELQLRGFLYCITFDTSSPPFCRISLINAFCSTHAQQSQRLSPQPPTVDPLTHTFTLKGTAAFGPHWSALSEALADKPVPD